MAATLTQQTELIARVLRFRFQAKDESGAVIAEVKKVKVGGNGENGSKLSSLLRSVSHTVVVGNADHTLIEGHTFRFIGEWTEHPQYGRQFQFRTFVRHQGHDRAGVIRYLRETAPHVGETTAAKLWDKFQGDAVNVLRDRPAEVVAAGIMADAAATVASAALTGEAGMQNTKVDLWTLFDGLSLPRTIIPLCMSRWGAKAAEVVKRNPYTLMVHRLPGCSFNRCDKLYLKLGFSRSRLKRQTLFLLNLMQTDSTGDSWFSAVELGRTLRSEIGQHAKPADALILGVRVKLFAKWRDEMGVLWIAPTGRDEAEEKIAGKVKELQGITAAA